MSATVLGVNSRKRQVASHRQPVCIPHAWRILLLRLLSLFLLPEKGPEGTMIEGIGTALHVTNHPAMIAAPGTVGVMHLHRTHATTPEAMQKEMLEMDQAVVLVARVEETVTATAIAAEKEEVMAGMHEMVEREEMAEVRDGNAELVEEPAMRSPLCSHLLHHLHLLLSATHKVMSVDIPRT